MRILQSLLLIAVLVPVFGCAMGTGRVTEELLIQDYRTMSDQDLQTYYYQLNDQIARVERRSRGTGVGLGIGTGVGSRTGVGVGVSQGVSRGVIAEDLRERSNEVRLELSRRGLRP